MCGVYTDNQPDFSWLHPYEEKSFSQYFIPYHNVGVVKNATKDALLNLELKGEKVIIKIHVTAVYTQCKVLLSDNNQPIFAEKTDLRPDQGFERTVHLNNSRFENLTVILEDRQKNTLVSWSPENNQTDEMPEPAKAARPPETIKSVEALYLQGLHLEQYRHATFDPTDYYLEVNLTSTRELS